MPRAHRVGGLCLVAAFAMGCSTRAIRSSADLPPGPVLWVGAHPDDELFVSPILDRLCVREGRRCTLLVLTQGEAGLCRLPEGCPEGMAQVRTRELERSADRLHATLIRWDLGDVRVTSPAAVLGGWEARAGGGEALQQKLREALRATRPGLLMTFDPRHGSTCHPAHRQAAALILRAAEAEGIPLPAHRFVLAVRRQIEMGSDGAPRWIGILPAPDADRAPVSWLLGPDDWQPVLDVMTLHPSQFRPEEVQLAAHAPAETRRLLLLPASAVPPDALAADPHCPPPLRY